MNQRDRFEWWKLMELRPSPVMIWTLEHTGRFLDAVTDHRLYALYHLIIFRGLRRSEVCGLRPAGVDLARGTVTIENVNIQWGSHVEESDPKAEASSATVSLDKETVDYLKAWFAAQKIEKTTHRRCCSGQSSTTLVETVHLSVRERQACSASHVPSSHARTTNGTIIRGQPLGTPCVAS